MLIPSPLVTKSVRAIAVSIYTISLVSSNLYAAEEMDSKKIFEKVEPSVVMISDLEGGGSGIVLSEDGLILTNFHVVNTPLPLSVTAFVEEKGRQIRKVFNNVMVMKVHPNSDLALIKLNPAGLKFIPAGISKTERDTAAGGNCYAMGFPLLPGQDKPTLTITKGIISSANRLVGGQAYIQMDAAINPGNSGGALVNDRGIVIGIPTLKFESADRIGLAVPLAGLKMDQFIKPDEKKGNPEEAARLSALARRLETADILSSGWNPEAALLAIYLQREAIALDPKNPKRYLTIASMYYRQGKYAVALAYAESVIRQHPPHLEAYSFLADIQEALKEPKQAAKTRLATFSIPQRAGDEILRPQITEKLAGYYVATNDCVRALYILSWGKIPLETGAPATTRLIMQKIENAVPEALKVEILSKKSGHSVDDMDAFANRAPAGKVLAENTPLPPADISKVKPVIIAPTSITSEVTFKQGVKATLLDAPEGVVFNQETGALHWTPAPFSKQLDVSVLFLLLNPDGTEETVIHKLERK